MTDSRRAALFDIAYDHIKSASGSDRKRRANATANKALFALDSLDDATQRNNLRADLEREVGVRGAARLMTELNQQQRRAPSPNEPHPTRLDYVAVLTGTETDPEADQLAGVLRAGGTRTFFYRDSIPAGRRSRKAIEDAITEADFVVLLVCRAALESNELDYERDVLHRLEMGTRREKLIVVVMDDLRRRELPPDLGIVQAIHWSPGGVGGVVAALAQRVRDDKKQGAGDVRGHRGARKE